MNDKKVVPIKVMKRNLKDVVRVDRVTQVVASNILGDMDDRVKIISEKEYSKLSSKLGKVEKAESKPEVKKDEEKKDNDNKRKILK